MDSVLAQAIPTPTMVSSKTNLLWMKATEISPIAPPTRQRLCVCFRPMARAMVGRKNAKAKQTAEYSPKQMPPHSTPSE